MQTIHKSAVLAALSMLLLAGCESTRMDGINTAPTPVLAAPAGTVTQNQLPAPTSPAAVVAGSATPGVIAPGMSDPNAFPAAPTAPGTPAAGTKPVQVASAGGADVTVSGVAGVWNVSLAGQNCKVATPQTKYGQGFRAGPLKCPGEMANVKSWNVAGKQLSLYDESGATIARLFTTTPGRFDGQTTGGSPISLSR
jgi:Protease inhibitor Inh